LLGNGYDLGKYYRGIWGLYGSYSYMAPQIFRLASTALSLGTTGQWRVTDSLAVQGTGLLGVGYATVSTIGGISDERANQYGVAPHEQHAVSLRYQLSRRDFDLRDLGNRIHDRGTVGIFYTLLGRDRFGAGD
jgi:hypothetical protein